MPTADELAILRALPLEVKNSEVEAADSRMAGA